MTATKSLAKYPVHKRRTVENSLRELVSTLTPGDRLPPLPDLRRYFRVASGTIQAAVDVLSQEGLVIRRHGAGTFVAESPVSPPQSALPAPVGTDRSLVVFVETNSPYFQDCLDHLIVQAGEQGWDVECRYANRELTLDEVMRYETREAAGFLAIGAELEWIADAMIARGHRAAVLGEPRLDVSLHTPAAFSDAEQGGYLATRHLIEQGHRRIAYLYINSPEWMYQRRRWTGHLRALHEAGIDDSSLLLLGNTEVDSWYRDPEAARRFFSTPAAPTAVSAWADPSAIQLLGALQTAGIRVPEDVSLIGYNNFPASAHCWPPLDSVDQHTELLVRHALFLLSLPAAPQQAVSTAHIIPTLVCRGSCGPPRTEDKG